MHAEPLDARWQHEVRAAISAVHDPKKRARAVQRFERTQRAVSSAAPLTIDVRELRAAAARELSVPGRYRLGAVRPPPKSWLQRAWDWVADRAGGLLRPLFSRLRIGKTGAAVVGDLLIVLFIGIVGYAGARLLRAFTVTREEPTTRVSPLEARRNAHALMLEATALASQGRHSEAVRTLFGAAVTLLDLRGAISDDAAATVNQLRRELADANAAATAPFSDIANAFTAAAYAERPVGAGDWSAARDAYQRLSATVAPA